MNVSHPGFLQRAWQRILETEGVRERGTLRTSRREYSICLSRLESSSVRVDGDRKYDRDVLPAFYSFETTFLFDSGTLIFHLFLHHRRTITLVR